MGLGLERHISLGSFILAGQRGLAAGYQQSLRAVFAGWCKPHPDLDPDSYFNTDRDGYGGWWHSDSDGYYLAISHSYAVAWSSAHLQKCAVVRAISGHDLCRQPAIGRGAG